MIWFASVAGLCTAVLGGFLDFNRAAGVCTDCVLDVGFGTTVKAFSGPAHRRQRARERYSRVQRYADIATTAIQPIASLAVATTLSRHSVEALDLTLEMFSRNRHVT